MKILVTGGGGFLGKAIGRKLRAEGHEVTSFSRGHYPELEKLGIKSITGDLADPTSVKEALRGMDVCFHVGAKAGFWGSFESYFNPNVLGTRHVIAGCQEHGVAKLIYTSSPSVIFDMKDQDGVNEDIGYPSRYFAHYPRTKAEAEREVLAANSETLKTVALRPHLIWGPGDNHILPRMVARARAGRIRLIGSEKKLVDAVYIDNAADAHLAALNNIERPDVNGGAFFVTNDEPIAQEDFINKLLGAAGEPPITRRLNARIAYGIASALEFVFKISGSKSEPPLTRFVARQLCTSHWFDTERSKAQLGYDPKISMAEGFQRLKEDISVHGIKKTSF